MYIYFCSLVRIEDSFVLRVLLKLSAVLVTVLLLTITELLNKILEAIVVGNVLIKISPFSSCA